MPICGKNKVQKFTYTYTIATISFSQTSLNYFQFSYIDSQFIALNVAQISLVHMAFLIPQPLEYWGYRYQLS